VFQKFLLSSQVRKIWFPASRPDAQLSNASTVRTHIRLKHHPSGRCGFPSGPSSVSRSFELLQLASVRTIQQPVRTILSVRSSFEISFRTQIWEDCCNRPDDVVSHPNALIHKASIAIQIQKSRQHGSNARASDMEIACIRSAVRTTVPLVLTREAFILKLFAADVRPFGRQCLTIRTRLSKRKIFSEIFGRTVVCPDSAQFYQGRCSFELFVYK